MTLLDLFCGGGGASKGYYDAGFTKVIGVDISPQPNYPFKFYQMNAMRIKPRHLDRIDLVHASPPCQGYAWCAKQWDTSSNTPQYIAELREILESWKLPYVIENVLGAPLYSPIMLCGEMFKLKVIRHRLFETNWGLKKVKHKRHKGKVSDGYYVTVAGHGGNGSGKFSDWCDAMGIHWMTRKELTESIPPKYTEYIGRKFLASMK